MRVLLISHIMLLITTEHLPTERETKDNIFRSDRDAVKGEQIRTIDAITNDLKQKTEKSGEQSSKINQSIEFNSSSSTDLSA